jgi:hypothetical protein
MRVSCSVHPKHRERWSNAKIIASTVLGVYVDVIRDKREERTRVERSTRCGLPENEYLIRPECAVKIDRCVFVRECCARSKWVKEKPQHTWCASECFKGKDRSLPKKSKSRTRDQQKRNLFLSHLRPARITQTHMKFKQFTVRKLDARK